MRCEVQAQRWLSPLWSAGCAMFALWSGSVDNEANIAVCCMHYQPETKKRWELSSWLMNSWHPSHQNGILDKLHVPLIFFVQCFFFPTPLSVMLSQHNCSVCSPDSICWLNFSSEEYMRVVTMFAITIANVSMFQCGFYWTRVWYSSVNGTPMITILLLVNVWVFILGDGSIVRDRL